MINSFSLFRYVHGTSFTWCSKGGNSNQINYQVLHSWKENMFKMYVSTIQIVCVEVLRPSQPNGVMLSAVSLPNHMFTGQA